LSGTPSGALPRRAAHRGATTTRSSLGLNLNLV
jgi:hypothetical protein